MMLTKSEPRKPTPEEYQAIIEAAFPKLKTSSAYKITSPPDGAYNCVAWANKDNKHIWWPDGRWPRKVSRKIVVESFKAMFAKTGYTVTLDRGLEPNFEKVAIFAKNGVPLHASRQLTSGLWSSKMGLFAQDITHDLSDIEGGSYGDVVVIMKKAVKR